MTTDQRPLIVVGCPVANRGWILERWVDAIELQVAGDEEHRWRPIVCYTPSTDNTATICHQHGIRMISGGEWTRPAEEMQAHRWPLDHIEHMAVWRNQLLQYCRDVNAEWFFSVDSDIILPPDAAKTLLKNMDVYLYHGYKAISPLVNMAGHLDPGTFAWNWMDWNDGAGVVPLAYRSGRVMPEHPFKVDVIMAAMLIHRSAFDVEWAAHEAGEDIGWSWNARQRGYKLVVDPSVICNHVMRPL